MRWTVLALVVVSVVTGLWYRHSAHLWVNPALALANQITIDGFDHLHSGVVFDDPPTAYADYLGGGTNLATDFGARVHAPGLRTVSRTETFGDYTPERTVVAVGDAPHGCEVTVEMFLPGAAPYAFDDVGTYAALLRAGSMEKLMLSVDCP